MEDHSPLLDAFNYTDLILAPAQGFSGGMAILWRANEILVDPITITAHEIHASVQVSPSSPTWLHTLIYASTSYTTRKMLENPSIIF